MTQWWINENQIFIFGWPFPLRKGFTLPQPAALSSIFSFRVARIQNVSGVFLCCAIMHHIIDVYAILIMRHAAPPTDSDKTGISRLPHDSSHRVSKERVKLGSGLPSPRMHISPVKSILLK